MPYGGYHSGGAGYVLSREAMMRIGKELAKNFTYCQRYNMEDIDLGFCMKQLGIRSGKSIDELGRERFDKEYNNANVV